MNRVYRVLHDQSIRLAIRHVAHWSLRLQLCGQCRGEETYQECELGRQAVGGRLAGVLGHRPLLPPRRRLLRHPHHPHGLGDAEASGEVERRIDTF